MDNAGEPQYDYESFKQIYDSSDAIQPLVKDFNNKGVRLSSKKNNNESDPARNADVSKERISNTAASAAPKSLKDRHKINR